MKNKNRVTAFLDFNRKRRKKLEGLLLLVRLLAEILKLFVYLKLFL